MSGRANHKFGNHAGTISEIGNFLYKAVKTSGAVAKSSKIDD